MLAGPPSPSSLGARQFVQRSLVPTVLSTRLAARYSSSFHVGQGCAKVPPPWPILMLVPCPVGVCACVCGFVCLPTPTNQLANHSPCTTFLTQVCPQTALPWQLMQPGGCQFGSRDCAFCLSVRAVQVGSNAKTHAATAREKLQSSPFKGKKNKRPFGGCLTVWWPHWAGPSPGTECVYLPTYGMPFVPSILSLPRGRIARTGRSFFSSTGVRT